MPSQRSSRQRVLASDAVSRLCGADYELACAVSCFEKAGETEVAEEAEKLFKALLEFRHRMADRYAA